MLLLDEPSVGQDYRGLDRLVDALGEIHERWAPAMVIVTHDRRSANALGRRIIWLEGGHVHADGVHELIERHHSRHLVSEEGSA